MLEIWRKPEILSLLENVSRKVVTFRCSNEAINQVARQRRNAANCKQWPNGADVFPKVLEARVTYLVREDGFIQVQTISVLEDRGEDKLWHCFFDVYSGCVGEHSASGKRHFFYLEGPPSRMLDKLMHFEDTLSCAHLNKQGPAAFDDEDSEDQDLALLDPNARAYAREHRHDQEE